MTARNDSALLLLCLFSSLPFPLLLSPPLSVPLPSSHSLALHLFLFPCFLSFSSLFLSLSLSPPLIPSHQPIDHKNIRRRVYDALNVLMAMNIISKEKKDIKWIGLPTNSVQECQHIEVWLFQYFTIG